MAEETFLIVGGTWDGLRIEYQGDRTQLYKREKLEVCADDASDFSRPITIQREDYTLEYIGTEYGHTKFYRWDGITLIEAIRQLIHGYKGQNGH